MKNNAPSQLSRRRFLRGLGVGAGLAPFLPLFNASGAAETAIPRRLVLLYTPHATYWPGWLPSGTPSNFTLGPILQPLATHKAKLNIITGMQMLVGPQGAAHIVGGSELWTGSNCDGTYNSSTAPSVDQVIATALAGSTLYRSLQFRTWCASPQTTIFAGANQPLFGESDPKAALANLFGNISTATSTRRKSVLDLVTKQLTALQPKLPAAERAKMQAHLTGVRELELRLAAQTSAETGPDLTADTSDSTGFLAMLDLVAAALTTDLTRIAAVEFGQWNTDGTTYPDIGVTGSHHLMTHMNPSDTLDENGAPVTDQTKSINGQLQKIYTFYATCIAKLLDRLDSVPEGNGTMLDNTLVIWGSEVADHLTHSFAPSVPFVVAGGSSVIKGGRWLDYTAKPIYHNRLLVSACNFMNLPNVATFGNMDGDATPGCHAGSGPLAGL